MLGGKQPDCCFEFSSLVIKDRVLLYSLGRDLPTGRRYEAYPLNTENKPVSVVVMTKRSLNILAPQKRTVTGPVLLKCLSAVKRVSAS